MSLQGLGFIGLWFRVSVATPLKRPWPPCGATAAMTMSPRTTWRVPCRGVRPTTPHATRPHCPGACQMTFGGRISQTPIGDAVRHTNQLKGNNDHALPPIPFHTPKFTSVGAWLEATNLP